MDSISIVGLINNLNGNNARFNGGIGGSGTNNGYGFYLNGSDSNNLTGNNAFSNTADGIVLNGSDHNNLTGNNAIGNGLNGIALGYSHYNTSPGTSQPVTLSTTASFSDVQTTTHYR